MFSGYVTLDGTFVGTLLVTDTNETPLNADALPTFRVYGPNGYLHDGTCSEKDGASLTDATNATPIVITSSNHGLTTGSYITIENVAGNTAANGTWHITKINANTFSLDDSVGNGSYTSGGDWNVAGLYEFSIAATGVNGYETGEVYQVHFLYELSDVVTSQVIAFQVN